jgi:outer membrane receptor protein involved in Fe transport
MVGTSRRALLATTVIASMTFSSAAFAQQPTEPAPVEPTPTETVQDTDAQGTAVNQPTPEIVVTGSRIRRPNLENSTPTTVVGEETFQATNATNFADVATQLPQFQPAFGESRTQSTFSGAAASGLQLSNLRNLGTQRTLVLMNGRRLAGGTTTSAAVDFNTLPSSNIDRVEIVTGGASAIYGADAVAGVINIITRNRFKGIELGASYRIAQEGDDATPMAYGLFGADVGEGGHVLVTLEGTHQGEVSCRDRYLCAEDFAWFPPADPVRGPGARSGVSAFGRFFLPNGSSVIRTGQPFSTALYGFNRNETRTIAQDTERYMVAAEASYEIYPWLVPFVEGNYGLARTQGSFEGHPFQSNAAGSQFGGGPNVAGLSPSIPIYISDGNGGQMINPIIPSFLLTPTLQQNPQATQITWWQRFGVEGTQGRGAENERQMFRGLAGLKGEFDLGLASPWNYEVTYTYGQTTLNSLTRGLISTRQLYYGLRTEPVPGGAPGALQCADPGARASGCVPINPFDGFQQNEIDALSVDAGQHGRSQLKDALAYVSGDLVALPGGNLSLAMGLEKYSFSGFLDYDEEINNAQVTGNQIGDVDPVKRGRKEAFIEAVAPIYGGQPWLQSLTLEGAYRISDPNVGKNYNTWRYGGSAEFIPGLRLRAMRAKAVREPVPGELSGIGQDFGVITDPCIDEPGSLRQENPTVAANCLAAGVPVGYSPPLSVRQGTGGFVGGNPNLEPEKSKTLTYGIAFAPTRSGPLGFLNGLQLTADHFSIKMTDVINTVGRQEKVDACYETGEFCADVQRGPNPLVVGPIALLAVNDQLINVASWKVAGWDLEARYSFALPFSGAHMSVQALATRYTKAQIISVPGAEPDDYLGFAGGSTSQAGWLKWSGTGNVNVGWHGTTLNWNLRYIGAARPAIFQEDPKIPAHWYHNVRLSQRVGENYEFYTGVNNLLNTKPPFFPSGASGTQALDTIPAYYDVFGREYYAGVRLHF